MCHNHLMLPGYVSQVVPESRDAKCHGYDGLIRVKILASWGKSFGEHTILKNEAFFGGDVYNLCEMSLSKLS